MTTKESYRVKKGDTWTSIAKRFGSTTAELAKANGRPPRSRLKAGETISIPLPESQRLFIGVKSEAPKFKAFTDRLMADSTFRREFLKNPGKTLTSLGIKMDPALLPKDFPILRLMDDKEFQRIMALNKVDDIREYLSKHYPELVTPSVRGPAHVVDAVEAVAVALPAVAVADPVV